jgi:hypothetical protein
MLKLKWIHEFYVVQPYKQHVLRRILTREGGNKLSSRWEGSFQVTQVCYPRYVHLATQDGTPLLNP